MERLLSAQARLSAAMDQLEAAARNIANKGESEDDVARLRAEADLVRDRNRQLGKRLDAAIAEIKSLLEA